MPIALALRHVAFEDLGLLAPWLTARGWRIQTLEVGVDPLDPAVADAADLLVVLGGPIGAEDDARYPFLTAERALIRRRLDQQRPLLGLCLGAQLIASGLGARVRPMARPEIGLFPIHTTAKAAGTPLAGLEGHPVLHWHSDAFEPPPGVAILARSAGCPTQAFQVGKHALALQFHLEADPARFMRWLIGHAGELARAGLDPGVLQDEFATHADALALDLDHVMSAFVAGWETPDDARP
jgi:GMP synthase (glutamine-hydrolysing)